MKRGWWIAIAIVVAANVLALGGAAWNRGGEPDAILELTERELELPPAKPENTALVLWLRWSDPSNERVSSPQRQASSPAKQSSRPLSADARVASWFDRARLEAVGFDCGLPLDDAHRARYRAMPPRRVYAVLEYDGEAWRSLERSIVANGEDPSRLSRLMVVDAGLDRAALRVRWPDRRRAVVVPATAVLLVDRAEDGRLSLRGRIVEVYPSQLNVPRPLNRALAPLQPRAAEPARGRYRVKVAWGRSDPWIEDVLPAGR
jgi:hypothetical protein